MVSLGLMWTLTGVVNKNYRICSHQKNVGNGNEEKGNPNYLHNHQICAFIFLLPFILYVLY